MESHINFTYWLTFHAFIVDCWLFSKLTYFKKFYQEHYQSVKQFGSISGPKFCQSESWKDL